MKLRFRENSLRLRLNQREVQALAAGEALGEKVEFPGDARLAYVLQSRFASQPQATFRDGVITVNPPQEAVRHWSGSDEIGMYFDLPANGSALRIAIEKDLECVDGPAEERDPDAFPRVAKVC